MSLKCLVIGSVQKSDINHDGLGKSANLCKVIILIRLNELLYFYKH